MKRMLGMVGVSFGYLILCLSPCAAKSIYVTQNGTGSATGGDCSNAHAAAWFNNGANWSSGSSQISPGDTVHLCGIFTGSNGANILTVQSGGTSGNPITILFEANAKLTGNYLGASTGAFYCVGHDYIVLDGGTNGIIENTDDGTALGSQVDTTGVMFDTCNNSTIKNLTVQNQYVRTPNSTDSNTFGSGIVWFNSSSITISGNTVHDAEFDIILHYGSAGQSNWVISGNTLSHAAEGIHMGNGDTNASVSNVDFNGNDVSDLFTWDSPTDIFHCDGFHTFATGGADTITNMTIRNNYFHGNPGSHLTAWNYNSAVGTGAGNINLKIYNNLFIGTPGNDGALAAGQGDGILIANNTFINNSSDSSGHAIEAGTAATHVVIKNNVCSGYNTCTDLPDGSSSIGSVDNNQINCVNAGQCMYNNGFYTWAAWQAAGWDTHGLGGNSNPLLDGLFRITSGSPGVGAGANLSNLGIAGLNVDRQGNARSTSGPWDIGAYTLGNGVSSGPMPPSGLAVVRVQ